ncbi:MAG: Crp/Fnr family transcriptional regulator [Gammaproteobacteria bacterium]
MNKILKLNSRDRDILASTSLLKDLSPTAFNKVVDDVAVSSYEAKDLIFREGDAPEYFYTVLTGFVRAYRLNREGREADIAVYGPGDTFAETGIFNNTAYDFNAHVADDRLHTAPQRVANFILKNCPDAAESARFRLPFQKSLLAGKLGLAPEALSRAFSSLKAAGVSVRGRVIEIKDVNALRRF